MSIRSSDLDPDVQERRGHVRGRDRLGEVSGCAIAISNQNITATSPTGALSPANIGHFRTSS